MTATFTSRLDSLTKGLLDTKNLDIDARLKPLLQFIDELSAYITGRLFDAADGLIEHLKQIGDQKKELFNLLDSFDMLDRAVSGFASSFDILPGKFSVMHELNAFIQDTAHLVTELRDLFELLGAVGAAAIDAIGATLTGLLDGGLRVFGIKIDAITKAFDYLTGNFNTQTDRISQGFSNTRTLDEALRRRQEYQRLVTFAPGFEAVDPQTGRPYGSTSGTEGATLTNPKPKLTSKKKSAEQALRELKQLYDARLSLVQSNRQNDLKLLEDSLKREQELLQHSHEENLMGEREYFQKRATLTTQGVEAELANLVKLATETQKQMYREKANSPERLRMEERLNDILTQQTLKRREIVDIQTKLNWELEKTIKNSIKAAAAMSGELARELNDKATGPDVSVADPLAGLRRRAGATELYNAQMRRDETKIQNAIATGVLTEAQGRRALLEIQGKYKDRLLEAYEAQKKLTRATETDTLTQEIGLANVDVQIEQLKTLSAELTNTQL